MIDVSKQERVYWAVPVPGKLVPRDTVPPIRIKASIGEVSELGQNVEHTLPDEIPLYGYKLVRCADNK
jgi:hypothetical protein